MRPPWVLAGPVSQDLASFPYELYDLSKDWTQYDNVAEQYPDKLKELESLFWVEASKYQVLPLDATVATRIVAPRPSLAAGRTKFSWSGSRGRRMATRLLFSIRHTISRRKWKSLRVARRE